FVNAGGGQNADWLNAVYTDILGRQVDPGAAQVFLNQLAGGVPRVSIALALLESTEYRTALLSKTTTVSNLLTHTPASGGFYGAFLGRSPSQAEINSWLAAFAAGATDETLITSFIASPEYFQRTQATLGGTTQFDFDQRWLNQVYQQLLVRSV